MGLKDFSSFLLLFRVDSKSLNESFLTFDQESCNSFVDTFDQLTGAALTIFDREYAQTFQLITCFNFQKILL